MSDRFDYAEAAADAVELLEEFGAEMVLSRPAQGGGPAHDPGPQTFTTYRCLGAVLPASKGTIQAFDNRLDSDGLVNEKLRYVILAATMTKISGSGPATVEPRSTDLLTFDGIEWTVLGATPLKPAGIAVYFGLGCKRA